MLFRLFVVLCTLCSVSLSARLEDHFKRASNKGRGHHIRNVDFIYMINLDKRPEKFASSLKQLRPYGIKPYRFSAVNGWELTLSDINDVGVTYQEGMRTDLMGTYYPMSGEGPLHEKIGTPGRTYFSHCMSRGSIGIVLSHLSILQDALKSGYKTIWVMEDDVRVVRNPRTLSKLIDRLDKKVGKGRWDILFTDRDTIDNTTGRYVPCRAHADRLNFTPRNPERFMQQLQVGKSFRRIGARYGMYSYIIRRSGMKKVLSFIKEHKIFFPVDMDFYLPSQVKIYTVRRDVVSTQRFAPSDNGSPEYRIKKSG